MHLVHSTGRRKLVRRQVDQEGCKWRQGDGNVTRGGVRMRKENGKLKIAGENLKLIVSYHVIKNCDDLRFSTWKIRDLYGEEGVTWTAFR